LDTENILEYITEGVGEFVQTLFPPDFKGTCIDVGAYDPFWISNSYLFEQAGWNVYCIEPNPHCIPKLKKYRKNVLQYACSNKNEDNIDFYIYALPTCGEAAGSGLLSQPNGGIFQEKLTVTTRTLDWLMENKIKQDHIDFLSIDVERNEVNVLKGTNLDRWKPSVIAIENLYGFEKEDVVDPDQFEILSKYGYQRIYRVSFNDVYILGKNV
jgi:FkbM family methyltransferase